MATITIRNLEETTKSRLRVEAAKHGLSMEEYARRLLRRGLGVGDETGGLGSRIHGYFAESSGIELQLPGRSPVRPAPDFSDKGP